MITVDEEYVFGREVDASYLCADYGEKQLQAYNLVAAHADLAVATEILATSDKAEVCTCHNVLRCKRLIGNASEHFRLLFIYVFGGLCAWFGGLCGRRNSLFGNSLLARTGCEQYDEQYR